MKKSLLLVLIGVAAAAALFSVLRPDPAEWTTSSTEALEEFQRGREAVMRLYHDDAREHFERALDLDNDFAAARLMAYRVAPYREREALLKDIKRLSIDDLQPHEQFLIGYEIAMGEGNTELAEDLLDDFTTSYPESSWGLEKKAEMAWRRYDFDTAETRYRALLEAEPNWVTAENNLGYIAMGRGDFEAAEEHFRTYQYIAPDQANPHDSRGELLTLIGEYEEAWNEFARALEIRPDFCASYVHQVTLAAFASYDDRIPGVLDSARQHCDEALVERLSCQAQLVLDYKSGNHDAWLNEREDDECRDKLAGNIFLHRMAVLGGKEELAEECHSRVAKQEAEFKAEGVGERNPAAGFRLHIEGTRLLARGEVESAVDKFRQADESLVYMGHDVGLGKLINLVDLAVALELQGDESAAEAQLAEVLGVNPRMESFYQHRKQELAFLFGRA